MSKEVLPYSEIPQEARPESPNWVGYGPNGEAVDVEKWVSDGYAELVHKVIINEDGSRYDKVDVMWKPAVFIVVCGMNPENGEWSTFLQKELRPLAKDENGKQGSTRVLSIPSGLVRSSIGERPDDAAVRETTEETGLTPNVLIYLGSQYIDESNSSTEMDYFLTIVTYDPDQKYEQSLDRNEDITIGKESWYNLQSSSKVLRAVKSLAGITLARDALEEWDTYRSDINEIYPALENMLNDPLYEDNLNKVLGIVKDPSE